MLERALRLYEVEAEAECCLLEGQKAYNAREGIETSLTSLQIRKSFGFVRKHTMLERALRPTFSQDMRFLLQTCQKAYNAREGIETLN